jgi:hypothetical protein
MEFHHQIKHLWQTMPALANAQSDGIAFGLDLRRAHLLQQVLWMKQPELAGKRFLPLVCKELNLLCKLEMLMLRKDKPGGIWQSRDIDNRLKVVFDALRAPKDLGELGTRGRECPENIIYTLLEDDSLITHVGVETDELLGPPPGSDDSYVRLFITVDLSIYHSTTDNFGIF